MKKSLSNFLEKLTQQPGAHQPERINLMDNGQSVELVSEEEACAIRGGDKEYKPIYDDTDDYAHQWNKPSILFNFLDSM